VKQVNFLSVGDKVKYIVVQKVNFLLVLFPAADLRDLTGLLYQPRMIGDGDYGEIGGMKIGRGLRSTRRKPAPASFCPPQIPHD
jgi:hypothetical protein